jgi:hypothetical protein
MVNKRVHGDLALSAGRQHLAVTTHLGGLALLEVPQTLLEQGYIDRVGVICYLSTCPIMSSYGYLHIPRSRSLLNACWISSGVWCL